jgi:hypothetical protein
VAEDREPDRRQRHDRRRHQAFARTTTRARNRRARRGSGAWHCGSARPGDSSASPLRRSSLRTELLERYRRGGGHPEYRKALDGIRERDGRRFFLKNTAPNLAGAELQELVRAAIESNGGRITTSQNQGPRDEGRFRQIVVSVQFFATTPALQKILYAIEAQPPYLVVENMALRPLNAFRGFKPAAGQEPEVNVQLDVAAFAFVEAEKR